MKLVLAALLAWSACLSGQVLAQEPKQPAAEREKPNARTKAEQRRARAEQRRARNTRGKDKQAQPAAADASSAQPAATTEKPAPEGASSAATSPAPPIEDGSEIRKEGDTEVKVMEFTGLDIEGQLKTPQLLYFLNRLRAEFGRPRLPHRSFMPELERSAGERPLR